MARARASPTARSRKARPAYGVTTGVGSRKLFDIDADATTTGCSCGSTGSRRARPCRTRSCAAPRSGSRTRSHGRRPSARPELAAHLVAALNDDRLPGVRALGSIGQSDLAQMADLADGLLGDFELARGEAITLLNQSAFSTAYGALAFADAMVLLDALDHAGALDLEALGANRDSRPPGRRRSAALPRPAGHARPPRRAARGQRGRGAGPAGPAHVPDASPSRTAPPATPSPSSARSSRSSSTRRSRIRSCSSTRSADLRRQLRDAATCDRARPCAARARARHLDRGRARGEAPAGAADRAHGGPRRAAGAGRERTQRVRDRGAGVRGRGAAARPARLVRARLDDARRRESRTG